MKNFGNGMSICLYVLGMKNIGNGMSITSKKMKSMFSSVKYSLASMPVYGRLVNKKIKN